MRRFGIFFESSGCSLNTSSLVDPSVYGDIQHAVLDIPPCYGGAGPIYVVIYNPDACAVRIFSSSSS